MKLFGNMFSSNEMFDKKTFIKSFFDKMLLSKKVFDKVFTSNQINIFIK